MNERAAADAEDSRRGTGRRSRRIKRRGAGVATPGDDARVLPVDPALDERVGPARLPIAKRVADVMGRSPEMESEDDVESAMRFEQSRGELSDRSIVPPRPAPRPREDDPTAPRAIETAAEVLRVRRVARFLAFATLRPLARASRPRVGAGGAQGLNPGQWVKTNPNPTPNRPGPGGGYEASRAVAMCRDGAAAHRRQDAAGARTRGARRGGVARCEVFGPGAEVRETGQIAGEPAAEAHRRRRGVDGGFR